MKSVSFLKSAEQMVEDRPSGPMTTDDIVAIRGLEDARRGFRHDPEYKAKNRAETLGSMEVTRDYSPSERLVIRTPEDWPFEYRWCDDEHRKRVRMEPWVALSSETDWDEANRMCPTKTIRKEDGRIMVGGLFLARAPKDQIEKIRALNYQRSQRRMAQAVQGETSARTRTDAGGSMPGFESFDSMNRSTSRAGDGGVSMSGTLSDDPSV